MRHIIRFRDGLEGDITVEPDPNHGGIRIIFEMSNLTFRGVVPVEDADRLGAALQGAVRDYGEAKGGGA